MNIKKERFTRFPNEYIQCDIKEKFGISRKFYVTYLLIDKYRSYEDYSWITIRKVLNFYGFKSTRNKPKAFYEILDVLEYMINNKMIAVEQDLDTVSYDTGIEIRIIPENFDRPEKFTKITSSQYDAILMSESSLNKEAILLAFLYISSYIGCRPRKKDGTEALYNPEDFPEAFYKSLQHMADDLSMSKETINQCMEYLTDEKSGAILKKKVVGSVRTKDKLPRNVPNIYVINKEGYQREIQWAMNKLREIYDVSEFLPPTKN